MPDPKEKPNHPAPITAKHPLRYSIAGVTHTKEELKKIIAGADIPDWLKTGMAIAVDAKKTAAACLDLHVVDHANGDESGTWHVKGVHLGLPPKVDPPIPEAAKG